MPVWQVDNRKKRVRWDHFKKVFIIRNLIDFNRFSSIVSFWEMIVDCWKMNKKKLLTRKFHLKIINWRMAKKRKTFLLSLPKKNWQLLLSFHSSCSSVYFNRRSWKQDPNLINFKNCYHLKIIIKNNNENLLILICSPRGLSLDSIRW